MLQPITLRMGQPQLSGTGNNGHSSITNNLFHSERENGSYSMLTQEDIT